MVVTAALRGAGASSTRTSVIVFPRAMGVLAACRRTGRSALGGFFAMRKQRHHLALNAENSVGVSHRVNGYSLPPVNQRVSNIPLAGHRPRQVYETFEEQAGGKDALIGRRKRW